MTWGYDYQPFNSQQAQSFQQTEYRIGYTTSYSNGQYTPSAYQTPNTGPRRVIIHHNGDSIDTGQEDDYNPNWKYYHGWALGLFGERWYYDDGDQRYYWDGNGWTRTGWGDMFYSHNEATATPSLPVGDPSVVVCILLLLGWMGYDIFIRPMIKKDKE